jgi:hypothetical protein
MSLARPWEDAYGRLLVELDKRWGQTSPASAPTPWEGVAWNEYPGFSGKRNGEQVYISLSADLLSLSVFGPMGVRVVIRPEGLVDRFLKAIRFDWEFQTGNLLFDREFYIEQVKTDVDKKLVRDSAFQKLVGKLAPFVSLAVTDKGVHLSLMIEGESQLTANYLEERLELLSQLAKHVSELAWRENR